MLFRIIFGILFLLSTISTVEAQLIIGGSEKEVNFREGPGTHYTITHTIDRSNLLVVLPGKALNGFVEVFDVETSTLGYVYESLIHKTDTLYQTPQKYIEPTSENGGGDVELVIINRLPKTLFLWINNRSYNISPNEKVSLVFDEEDFTYFSSTAGTFPIYGKEKLKRGNTYRWNFSL